MAELIKQKTVKNFVELHSNRETDFRFDESIKTLRTNIQFSGSNIRVIMLTSTVPNEGKSSMAFETAQSLAQTGKKVLMVDADIRKSVLVTRYQLDHEVNGLSQLLSGQNTRDEVLFHTNVENLDMIFSGPFAPNPAELLGENAFDELLKWGRETYDYVVVDTPPIGSVIDGAIVAPKCDGVILVVASGMVSSKLIQRTKVQLEKTGCRILGVILNKVDAQSGGYYYSKYGSYYKHYGNDYYTAEKTGDEQ